MNRSAKFLATSEAGLAAQIGLQMLCGVLLAFWYTATPEAAHSSSESIRSHVIPRLIVSTHYWGAQFLMLQSIVHVSTMIWTGCYRGTWTARWYLALGVCACSFMLMVTGNLLPFDRHGVQSAVTEIAVANRVPMLGPVAADAMLHGSRFGGETLAAWYFVHKWLLPLALIALGGVFYALRSVQEPVRKSPIAVFTPSALAIVLGIAVAAPIGVGASKGDYTALNAVVNWYAWPIHGALRAFDEISPDLGWIGAVVLPLLVLAFLVALPRLCEKVTPMFVQAVFLVIVGAFAVMAVMFGGLPAPLVNRDTAGSQGPDPMADGGAASIEVQLAAKGRAVFSSVGCVSCHGQDGVGGISGPDLSAVGLKHADAAWFESWIHDPSVVKPGTAMPAFNHLDSGRLSALAEYLRAKRGR